MSAQVQKATTPILLDQSSTIVPYWKPPEAAVAHQALSEMAKDLVEGKATMTGVGLLHAGGLSFRPSNSKKDKDRKGVITSVTGHGQEGRLTVYCRLRRARDGSLRIEVMSFQGAWVDLPFKTVLEVPELKAAAAEAASFLDRLAKDAEVPASGSTEELPELRYSRIANLKQSPEKPKTKSPSTTASTSKKAESPAVKSPVASSSSKTPAQEPAGRNLTAVDVNKVAQMLGKRPSDGRWAPPGKKSTATPIRFVPMRSESIARPKDDVGPSGSGSSSSGPRPR